jgi:hypothetical protein
MKGGHGRAAPMARHLNRNASPSRVSSFAPVTCLTAPSLLSTGDRLWEPGPPDPRLTDGVLVWRADRDAVLRDVAEPLPG